MLHFSIVRKIRALPNPGYPVSMFTYALRICVTSTFTFETCRAALFSNCSTVESWSWACFIRWNHAKSLWIIFGRFSDRMSFCFHSTHDDVPVIFKHCQTVIGLTSIYCTYLELFKSWMTRMKYDKIATIWRLITGWCLRVNKLLYQPHSA